MTMYSHLAKGFAEAAQEHLDQVNERRLNSCSQHFFDSLPKDWQKKRPQSMRCVMCGGIVPFQVAEFYVLGYMLNGGDSELILPGFSA